jgi:hypothetical protein
MRTRSNKIGFYGAGAEAKGPLGAGPLASFVLSRAQKNPPPSWRGIESLRASSGHRVEQRHDFRAGRRIDSRDPGRGLPGLDGRRIGRGSFARNFTRAESGVGFCDESFNLRHELGIRTFERVRPRT